MTEYRDKPTQFAEPTKAEIKARSKRNIALALVLLLFVVLVFLTMVARGPLPNAG